MYEDGMHLNMFCEESNLRRPLDHPKDLIMFAYGLP